MRAMLFEKAGQPLRKAEIANAQSQDAGQVLIRVRACAVCRTDLHVVDGELTQPKLPLIPGHEIVGTVEEKAKAPSALRSAIASVFHGLGGPAASAPIVSGDERIFAIKRALPAIPSMAVMQTIRLRISAFVSRFRIFTGCRSRSAAVRRSDRIPQLSQGGRWKTSWNLRLWRGGTYRRSGCALSEP